MMRVAPRMLAGMLSALVLGAGGCAGRNVSPAALADAHAEALRRDDPSAVWRLLSPDLQAAMDEATFAARWRANAEARTRATEVLGAVAPDRAVGSTRVTTFHPGAGPVRWVAIAGEWRVLDGLPGLPDRSSPAAAVRALIAAIRGLDMAALTAVLDDALLVRFEEDWGLRVAAIEEALATPGALEVSASGERARLPYGGGRAVTLVRDDGGWRVRQLQ